MINFVEDSDLGKVIETKSLESFGTKPIESFKEIVFAAGGDKMSNLCKFHFVSKSPTPYKEFYIAFVCKLRSKIYHQQHTNPSQWFIIKKISDKEVHCLSKKDLLVQYGFDIEKFFDSDYFEEGLKFFKASINNALALYIPEYVKLHGDELAKDNLTSYDGNVNDTVKNAVGRYEKAITDSLKYLSDTRTNDKFYKLISYTTSIWEAAENDIFEGNDRINGYAIGTIKNGKLMFINTSQTIPYLTEFPYSTNDEPISDKELTLFKSPVFGNLDAKNYHVEYDEIDAKKFYKTGGKPIYSIIESETNEYYVKDYDYIEIATTEDEFPDQTMYKYVSKFNCRVYEKRVGEESGLDIYTIMGNKNNLHKLYNDYTKTTNNNFNSVLNLQIDENEIISKFNEQKLDNEINSEIDKIYK